MLVTFKKKCEQCDFVGQEEATIEPPFKDFKDTCVFVEKDLTDRLERGHAKGLHDKAPESARNNRI